MTYRQTCFSFSQMLKLVTLKNSEGAEFASHIEETNLSSTKGIKMKDENVLHSLLKHNSHSSNDRRYKACFHVADTFLSQN